MKERLRCPWMCVPFQTRGFSSWTLSLVLLGAVVQVVSALKEGLANGQSELASVHMISVMDNDPWYLLLSNGIERL
jgi:hypothetical protein